MGRLDAKERMRQRGKRMGHPVRGRECCLDDFYRGDLPANFLSLKFALSFLDSLPNEDPRKGMRKVNSRPLDEPGRERREGKRRGKENFF